MDHFGRFTNEARNVLTYAQDEAARLNHNYIGTEHMLLGLLRDEDGVAAGVLRDLGVDLQHARRAVEFIIGRGDRPVVGEVGLTVGAKRVIEFAIGEARAGSREIGPEHLLIGLVREVDGIAAGVLESLGVNLYRVRGEVARRIVARGSGTGAGSDEPAKRAWAASAAEGSVAAEAAGAGRGTGAAEGTGAALAMARRFVEVEDSPLRRVVAIGGVATHDGITLELVALEVRTAGAMLHWKARSDDLPIGGDLELGVGDDAGTVYATRPVWWSASGRSARGEIVIIPAPPDGAAVLRLAIWPSPGVFAATSGAASWTFEVRLGA